MKIRAGQDAERERPCKMAFLSLLGNDLENHRNFSLTSGLVVI
jgi:hypothetical protein